MNYFLVFQNKTFNKERVGSYLWAPQKTKAGLEKFFWSNMKKVKQGDIIFSVCNRKIVSINTALGVCVDAIKPVAFDSDNLWEKEGWLLNADYSILKQPISIIDNVDDILKRCPMKYSPFTSSGKGNQGYLYEIGKELGEFLINLV